MDAPLYNALCVLRGQKKGLRMHMPGHKGKESGRGIFHRCRSGLHGDRSHREPVYRRRGPLPPQALAARDWGAAQAFFLTGGSTQECWRGCRCALNLEARFCWTATRTAPLQRHGAAGPDAGVSGQAHGGTGFRSAFGAQSIRTVCITSPPITA